MPRITNGGGGVARAAGGSTGISLNWREVHQRVRELRRTFLHLSVKTPTDVTFRRLSPTQLRCYFLLSPGQGRESTLFYADINLDTVSYAVNVHLHIHDCSFMKMFNGLYETVLCKLLTNY